MLKYIYFCSKRLEEQAREERILQGAHKEREAPLLRLWSVCQEL